MRISGTRYHFASSCAPMGAGFLDSRALRAGGAHRRGAPLDLCTRAFGAALRLMNISFLYLSFAQNRRGNHNR